MIKIFDTKTKKIKEINKNEKINIYLCGPTVYDDLHIGNFRNIVIFNWITNLLNELKYDFEFIQNITDIDDKIIEKAIKENKKEEEITKKYTKNFLDLLKKFQIKTPKLINVTENIESIIDLIDELFQKKMVYKTNDGIYFDVSKDKGYGRIKKQTEFLKNENTLSNNKEDIQDFAIWKFKTKGKTWFSKWGFGRPGWHIECSLIVNKYFKNKLYIHGGGKDLIFPHHENEYAILNVINKKMENTIWLHNGFVEFEYEKISKSKDNFKKFLVKNLLNDYSANTIIIFFAFTNYKNDISFNFKHLNTCKNFEIKIKNTFKKINLYKFLKNMKETSKIDQNLFNEFLNSFANNLNTIKCLDLISYQLKNINNLLNNFKFDDILIFENTLKKCIELLGIKIKKIKFNDVTKKQIIKWNNYIKNKDFKKADELREILKEKNIL